MNKLMTSPASSGGGGSELLPPFVRLAGEDRLAGIVHHRDKKKCDVGDFGGAGGVTSSLYALTHDVIGFGAGGCGGGTLSTAVAAAGGVASSVAPPPPRGLGLADNTGPTPLALHTNTSNVYRVNQKSGAADS